VTGLCVYKQAGNAAYWSTTRVFKAQKEIQPDTASDKLLASPRMQARIG
jgi:hypothetical protein